MTTFWKDIDIEFNRKSNGDVVDMVNDDAIVNSLTNIFTTFQGARRMLPEFAMPIYNLLFEPVDEITASKLADMILDGVTRWEPRIVIEGLDIIADPDSNRYEIILNYYIGNAGNTDSLRSFETFIVSK